MFRSFHCTKKMSLLWQAAILLLTVTTSAFVVGPQDLRPGDILVWSTNKKSPFEKAIALLSGDEATHAAIVSRHDTNVVIEQKPPFATLNRYPWNRQGRKVTVLRFETTDDTGVDLDKVLRNAEESLKAKHSMSYKDLLTLAIQLLLRQPELLSTHSDVVMEGFIAFFKSFNEFADPTAETVNSTYCSQFVFDCFERAGHNLQIDRILDKPVSIPIADGPLMDVPLKSAKKAKKTTTNGINGTPLSKPCETALRADKEDKVDERIIDSFLQCIQLARKEYNINPRTSNGDEIVHPALARAIMDFANQFENPDNINNKEVEPMLSVEELTVYAMHRLKETNKSLVTPGDLLRIRNENVQIVGSFIN